MLRLLEMAKMFVLSIHSHCIMFKSYIVIARLRRFISLLLFRIAFVLRRVITFSHPETAQRNNAARRIARPMEETVPGTSNRLQTLRRVLAISFSH